MSRLLTRRGGSSPQMRGAQFHTEPAHACSRIIPADAGSTMVIKFSAGLSWDHPRRCGEHRVRGLNSRFMSGSSPQMRGAPVFVESESVHAGIIPADAGSTCPRLPLPL